MKFNWKYTIIGIICLAISLAGSAFLFGEDTSSPSSRPAGVQPSAPASDSNYSL